MGALSPIYIPINGIDGYSKEFKKLQRDLKRLSSNFKKVGTSMTRNITLPIIGIGVAGSKMAMDLNAAMADVQTLTTGGTESIVKMKGEVQSLAITVGKGSKDIAGGLYETISAFGEGEETMGRLTIASKAAKAGNLETVDSVRLLSAVTKGYGDTSISALEKVADLSFLTVKLGQTTFPELASSMGRVVPVAKSLNVSQEELFATMATLTGVTGNAAEVSTQLSSIMTGIVKPSAALTKTVQSMGYSSASTMVKELGLVKTLEKLGEVTEGDTDAMAALLGRKEALTAALALTGAQADVFTGKMGQMKNASGAMGDAFKAQAEGINKAGFLAAQSWERIMTALRSIGDKLLPIFADLITKLEPMFQIFENMGPQITGTVLALVGLLAALGPVLIIVGQAIGAFTAITGAMAAAGGAVALLSNPIGWAVAAVIALSVVTVLLWDKLKPLRMMIAEELPKAFGTLKQMLEPVFGVFQKLWSIFGRVVVILQPMIIATYKLQKFFNGPSIWLFVKALKVVGMVLMGILTGLDWLLIKLEKAANGVKDIPFIGKLFEASGGGQGPQLDAAGATGAGDAGNALAGIPIGGGKEEMVVKFENAPAGMKVTETTSKVTVEDDGGDILGGII